MVASYKGDVGEARMYYGPAPIGLAEHYAFWTPQRNEAERIAAALRVTLRRKLRKGSSFARKLDLSKMTFEELCALAGALL